MRRLAKIISRLYKGGKGMKETEIREVKEAISELTVISRVNGSRKKQAEYFSKYNNRYVAFLREFHAWEVRGHYRSGIEWSTLWGVYDLKEKKVVEDFSDITRPHNQNISPNQDCIFRKVDVEFVGEREVWEDGIRIIAFPYLVDKVKERKRKKVIDVVLTSINGTKETREIVLEEEVFETAPR
jgi:hypothetical protein